MVGLTDSELMGPTGERNAPASAGEAKSLLAWSCEVRSDMLNSDPHELAGEALIGAWAGVELIVDVPDACAVVDVEFCSLPPGECFSRVSTNILRSSSACC